MTTATVTKRLTAEDVLMAAVAKISNVKDWCPQGTKNDLGNPVFFHSENAVRRSSSSALASVREESKEKAHVAAVAFLVRSYGGNICDETLSHDQVMSRWNSALVAARS